MILVVVFAPFIEEISKFLMALLFVLGPKREKWLLTIILMITKRLVLALENSFLMELLLKANDRGIITGTLDLSAPLASYVSSATSVSYWIQFLDKFSHKVLDYSGYFVL
jgi:hypothetical protein